MENMRAADIGVAAVGFSAAWVALSSAYVFGVFIPYPTSYLGLLKVDDIVFGSFSIVCFVTMLMLPWVFLTHALSLSKYSVLCGLSDRYIAAVVAAVWLISIIFYMAAITRIQNVHWAVAFLGLLPSAVIINAGAILDRRHGGWKYRGLTGLLAGMLLSFVVGSAPGPAFSRQSWCTSVVSDEKILARGPLIYSASSGVFVEPVSGAKRLIYVPNSKFDFLISTSCGG